MYSMEEDMTAHIRKKAIIFCNGDLADLSRVRRHINKKTLLIGCDGGTSHILSLGLTPHVVIGDFDSIAPKTERALKGKEVEYFRYSTDKLYTDSELGLALAMERGCKEIILAGVRGTATDHLLGNLYLLAKKKYASLKIKIIEGQEEILLTRSHIRIKGRKGESISLIAVGCDASGVTTKGLFYPLKNAVVQSGTAQGIRNRLIGKSADIELKRGAILIIHQLT